MSITFEGMTQSAAEEWATGNEYREQALAMYIADAGEFKPEPVEEEE